MGTTDSQEVHGLGGVEGSSMKRLDGLEDEIRGQAPGELMLIFQHAIGPGGHRRGEAFRRPSLRSGLLNASPRR